jgi:hypothetical protein
MLTACVRVDGKVQMLRDRVLGEHDRDREGSESLHLLS